ncbi:F-box/LRR-repeat protein At4g14103-like [Magnolia sinica]|uniref:F-box/LRR-repeat protein At4g14103-like n=1 Tax=Magnolia sinica TaxID=86752 RepID=UPI0026593332|nr:F-box/LRR-repeat protein At4g14103-like [Magnolia sinica]
MANVEDRSYVCDRISNLPDDILHTVFSFLGAKSVVQTSLLSKRWRDLWISNPNLYLDDTEFLNPRTNKRKKDNGFVGFVNYLLILRDGTNIQKFCLSCNGWIGFAIQHFVQDLDLEMKTKIELPFSLFTCKSLVNLKLSSPWTFLKLKLPLNVLQNLRVLHLHHIRFSGTEVFLCCPLRENISMNKCDLGALKSLNISSPELQKLVITSWDNLKGCEISVSAPRLQSLEFQGDLSHGIYLSKPAPFEAIIDFKYMEYVSTMNGIPSYGRIIEFLNGLEEAKSLTLSTKFLEVLIPIFTVYVDGMVDPNHSSSGLSILVTSTWIQEHENQPHMMITPSYYSYESFGNLGSVEY